MAKVFKQFKMRMAKIRMAEVMYAVIQSKAKIHSTFGIGIYGKPLEYNRDNFVDVLIEIEESEVKSFEYMGSVQLENWSAPQPNNSTI